MRETLMERCRVRKERLQVLKSLQQRGNRLSTTLTSMKVIEKQAEQKQKRYEDEQQTMRSQK